MRRHLKKIYIAFTFLLMSFAAQLNAASNYNSSSCCEQTSCCDPAPCCKPICCDTPKSWVTFKGDLLYWTSELCGLESAFGSTAIITTVDGAFVTTTLIESDEKPDFKWGPGFRIGADVRFKCLNLEADWTHYTGRAKFSDGEQYGKWKMRYDTIDLTLGRRYALQPCFHLRPFFGVRGLKINQSLNSHLETSSIALIGNSTIITDRDDKEHFWGIGTQLGLEGDWYLRCNFSLYANADAVTYYGNVRGKNYDVDTFTSTASVTEGKKHRCFKSLATDAAIGIRWDKTWCCRCYDFKFMMKLGLEQHRIYDFSYLGSDGTLSLDGGILEAGIGFRY